MMDTPRAKPALGNLETTSLAQQHVAGGHADIFEDDFGMSVRRIIETEHRQRPLHGNTGMRQRHQDH